MNKYQEALNCLKDTKCDEINNCKQCSLTSYCGHYQCIKTLQELVDKETPKKIIIKKYGNFNVGDYYCPHCNCKTNEEFEPKYCSNCGGSIDWMV